MEFLTNENFKVLTNPGVTSLQLLSPQNSASHRVTITRVVVEPGAIQPPHVHPTSEQIWVAVSGQGTLILGPAERQAISAGDVVLFADGDVHGFKNKGATPFVYLSVTAPPIDFSYTYQQAR